MAGVEAVESSDLRNPLLELGHGHLLALKGRFSN
jgi:hypothetical protein